MTRRTADDQTIAAINVTPLIDVLLVLLIMMILTLPIATHKVAVDLPNGPARTLPDQKTHQLDISASGALTLDGMAVSERALPDELVAITADKDAVLTMRTDAATHYDTFDRVLATVKRAGITRLGFVGNEQFGGVF
ncbi:MAG: ExbD/TolR family protein [Sphingomonas sp.]|uniref:ExbD/TolR family protein n=1 Tax=Sphingomonas sp. TaxID=28214 RepID=UPI003F7EC966